MLSIMCYYVTLQVFTYVFVVFTTPANSVFSIDNSNIRLMSKHICKQQRSDASSLFSPNHLSSLHKIYTHDEEENDLSRSIKKSSIRDLGSTFFILYIIRQKSKSASFKMFRMMFFHVKLTISF